MAQIAIIVGMLLCAAGGWIAGDWQRQRIAAAEQAQLRERAESLSAALVAAERRVTAAEAARTATRQQGRALVAASSLRDCPLPDDVAGLLRATAAATGARAGDREAGAADVSGSSDAAVRGRGG